MLKTNNLRPIKAFATVLLVIGLIGMLFDIAYLNDPSLSTYFKIFGSMISLWHLLGGIGVLFQKSWGLLIFKSYLYVLLLGIPIGTYIASKTLRYIKDNELDKLFT